MELGRPSSLILSNEGFLKNIAGNLTQERIIEEDGSVD